MSVPPNTPPPGGVYYTSPPPPRSDSSGCWKAFGITCLVLVVGAVIVGVLVVGWVKREIAHPSRTSPIGFGITVGQASAQGLRIQRAVVEYRRRHGRYPARLLDLVSDGLIDGKILHSDLDENPSPGHISWRYTKPPENAPGDTPILDLPYRGQISFGGTSQEQSGHLIINLNGTSRSKINRGGYGGPQPFGGG